MHTASDFPQPTRIGGRLMFDRYDVEQHKRQLMGLSPSTETRRRRLCSSPRVRFPTNCRSTAGLLAGA